jgi:hypothetical protein
LINKKYIYKIRKNRQKQTKKRNIKEFSRGNLDPDAQTKGQMWLHKGDVVIPQSPICWDIVNLRQGMVAMCLLCDDMEFTKPPKVLSGVLTIMLRHLPVKTRCPIGNRNCNVIA